MRLSEAQTCELLRVHGTYITDACDNCGRLLGPVRFTRQGDTGVWCSRACRDGVDHIRTSAADAAPRWLEREEAQSTAVGPAECGQCERKSSTAKISLTRPYKTWELQTRIRGLTTVTPGRARMRTNSRGLRETMNAKTQSDRTPILESPRRSKPMRCPKATEAEAKAMDSEAVRIAAEIKAGWLRLGLVNPQDDRQPRL